MTDSITKSKNLRSGIPVWSAYESDPVGCSKLTKDLTSDIVIIGAGISGSMMAEELTDAGFSVIILDKRRPISGSTAATTALMMYEIDNPIIELEKQVGIEKAARVWRRSKLGVNNIFEKIRKLDIPCDVKARSSIYLSGNKMDEAGLMRESGLRNSLGLATRFLSKRQLAVQYGIKGRSAICAYNDAEINPVQLTTGFLRQALRVGARIYSPVDVVDVESGARQVRIYTKNGPSIKAKHVIFATGYEIPKFVHTKKHSINTTWVFATGRQKLLWPERALIWEASDPYLYIRTTKDRRVICGGEDEEFSDAEKRDALMDGKISTMQKKLGKLFPFLDVKADYTWSGDFGGSTTGLPTIGEIPGMANCYSVMGFGGNGITFSRIAAELIRARLTGVDDPDQSLFDFPRK